MVEPVDSKNLVKYIAYGRLNKICLLCLIRLENNAFESIFSMLCKEDAEYCIADALEAVCQFELDRSENYNICIDCFKSASKAYKFHLQAKRSMELITYYTEELLDNINNIEITGEDVEKLLLIPLSEYTPATSVFDFNIDGAGMTDEGNKDDGKNGSINYGNINDSIADENENKDGSMVCNQIDDSRKIADPNNMYETDSTAEHNNSNDSTADNNNFNEINKITDDNNSDENKNSEDNIIIVVEQEETPSIDLNVDKNYSMHSSEDEEMVMIINEKKVRKKRDPMASMTCSQCPVKYRFVAKLKHHMKTVHDIEIYYCKICKIVTEQKEAYEKHLKTHTDNHQCVICNMVYKKASTLVAHVKSHKKGKQFEQLGNVNVCELCGTILEDEASLENHMRDKHVKRYTCYYCGRMYRWEGSFDKHIRKHEEYWNNKQGSKPDEASSKQVNKQADVDKSSRSVCQTCGKDFVDERSLLWHQRLHSNDRPYICDVCGRGFVSKNRCSQHRLCAHSPPRRRCPLCPALFHLRSMVNTHVKKVHLKAHKRRNRSSKYQNVFWRTQPVPIQELSIDVQHDVLELRAKQGEELPEPDNDNPASSPSLFVL